MRPLLTGTCALVASMVLGVVAARAQESKPLPHPPNAVQVLAFETKKVMHEVGEPVTFLCTLQVSNATPSLIPTQGELVSPPLRVEVWDEHGLNEPVKMVEARLDKAAREPVSLELVWQPSTGLFGHQAHLRVFDSAGRELAQAHTLYEVADGRWQHLMRFAAMGGHLAAGEHLGEDDLRRIVRAMRDAHLNTLELFAWMPEPHDFTPETPLWKSAYYRRDKDARISAENIIRLGRLLHENGMKLVAYNETSVLEPSVSIPGQDAEAYKVYYRHGDGRLELQAPYKTSGQCFQPNSLKVADLFAREMAESVRRFDWDGILMDSATQAFYATANGHDAKGNRLTDLTPGQVGERYVGTARKAVHAVKPGFRFICQNVFASFIGRSYHYRQPNDRLHDVLGSYVRTNFAELVPVVDAWSAELDPHYEPQKNYPQTFDKYVVPMNVVRELTGKPILQWVQAAAAYPDDYSPAYSTPLLSTLAAARLIWNDHFANYGGNLGPWTHAPTNLVQRHLNRFVMRFSHLLRSPALKWIQDPKPMFSVVSQRPLFWEHTVYEQETPTGRQWVLNLLNHDSPYVRPQNVGEKPHVLPLVAFPVSVSWQPPSGLDVTSVKAYALDAEDAQLRPLSLAIERKEARLIVALPPIRSWLVVVFTQQSKER